MHRAGNRNSLTFTTRQGANRLIGAAQVDAHLAHLGHGNVIGVVMIKHLDRSKFLDRLVAHKEIPTHAHQRDHPEVLVHRRNPRRNRIARIGEIHRLALKHDLAFCGFMHPRHGLDERRLSGAVVTQ